MANRSYLYSHHPRAKVPLRDLSEWRTEPPLAHLILVGSRATPRRSAIWRTIRKIAIRGDAAQTRPVFLAFLDWLGPQLPGEFARAADEARAMLLRVDRQGESFHLELGEIFELAGFELAEMAAETSAHADQAEALFDEVRRLVVTPGTALADSTDERIRRLADTWEDQLGLNFPGILYFHAGGGNGPKARRVKVPPIPPPRRRQAARAKPASKPPAPGGAAEPKGSSLAAWQVEVLRRRRRAGQDAIAESDRVGWLHLAIDAGQAEAARALIAAGADVDALHKVGGGLTCLEQAAGQGDAGLVALLLDHGADPDHVGKVGPPLLAAIRAGNVGVYELLRDRTDRRHRVVAARHVAEALRSRDERERVRRFGEVCARGLLPTIRRLIRRGIDVNARCAAWTGQTPLALAAQGGAVSLAAKDGYEEIVELLLASGADPNLESYTGEPPLMRVGRAEICRRLLAAGADPLAVDDEGRNALTRLADAGCCRLLLEAGARAPAVDHRGRGVLWHVAWWARRRQQLGWLRSKVDARYDANLAEVFRLLIAAGARLDPPAADGPTALDLLGELAAPGAKQVLASAPARRRRGASPRKSAAPPGRQDPKTTPTRAGEGA